MKKLFVFFCALALCTFSQPASADEFTAREQIAIKKVQTFLNNITTMQANFQQLLGAHQGFPGAGMSEGKMYLKKPGHIKWLYHTPSDVEIYINKNVVTYYDKELDQISYAPLEHILSNLIAEQNIDLLNGSLKVTKIKQDDGGIAISIRKKPEEGETQDEDTVAEVLTLVFVDKPKFELARMQYWNSQGEITTILFDNIVYNQEIGEENFEFKNPRIFNPKKR